MIVTIDGPAGAGKSSAARELARRLGFRFLDTGAMYRAVTLAARERGLDLADARATRRAGREIRVELVGDRVLLDGRDVTKAIRKFDITTAIHYAADNPAVRPQLVEWQRAAADRRQRRDRRPRPGDGRVPARRVQDFSHGRRAGTRTPPPPRPRGARREHSFDEVLANQRMRDQRDDRARGCAGESDDAIEVSTDGSPMKSCLSSVNVAWASPTWRIRGSKQ